MSFTQESFEESLDLVIDESRLESSSNDSLTIDKTGTTTSSEESDEMLVKQQKEDTNQSINQSDSESDGEIRLPQRVKKFVIDSETDDDQEDHHERTNIQKQTELCQNISDQEECYDKSRLSSQFRLSSKEIMNSTAFPPDIQLNEISEKCESISANSSVQTISDDDTDIIEASSEYEREITKNPLKFPQFKPKSVIRQQTLNSFVIKKEPDIPFKQSSRSDSSNHVEETRSISSDSETANDTRLDVSNTEYEAQVKKVKKLEGDYANLANMVRTINMEALSDKGKLIKDRKSLLKAELKSELNKLKKMVVAKDDPAHETINDKLAWENLEAGTNAVLPKTQGKRAMATYNTQKAVTLDKLKQLHGALQTCPKEEETEEDPKGLKVPLMLHQKRALAWLLFREKEKPSGGILADDMGLGKTLTMISLIVKSLSLEEDDDDEDEYVGKYTKHKGGTLIVCPASLLNQWSGEIDRRLKRGLISYYVYHGPKRETSPRVLSNNDVVITTYSIINNENDRNGAVFRVKWRRIILDEAHQIRNSKSQTSAACCQLMATSRWALTGTPMHNKELDLFALLKFLRCSPFDDLQVYKRWVGDKSTGGQERLHTVISSLMLRRTKIELMEKGILNHLPDKKWELVDVKLDKNELDVYHKVLIFSQTLFAQFLHQKAEKSQGYVDKNYSDAAGYAPNQEYFKMREKLLKLNKVKNVTSHEILVLLLRLRQICCHPFLISSMLDNNREDIGEGDEECEELNLLDQLENLNIKEDDEDTYNPNKSFGISEDTKVSLKEASKGHLNPSDPVFSRERASTKIRALLKILQEKVLDSEDKAIIVSQWSSYLNLIGIHLKKYGVEFDQLDGKVPVNKRMSMVERFNDPKDPMKVLLLSLTAGGVGLNLIGANYLFLLDLHWNPQLELQAQDRIYRVGQTKKVFVYKFMAVDTLEERIKNLQDRKMEMANGILTGTSQIIQSKLSLDELRMIFGM